MKNSYKLILGFALLIISISACDVIDAPYRKSGGVKPPIDTTERIQRILLEDFTGHTCVNCPDAHRIAKGLQEKYPGQVIVIAEHVGESFAAPTAEHPYDFRTPTGNTLGDFFKSSTAALPIGMVNRIPRGTARLIYRFNWEEEVGKYVKNKAPMAVKITPSYDDTKKEISASVEVKYFADGSASQYLCVYILEDSIVSYQKANPSDFENYVHNHVLRGSLNGPWGTQLSSTEIKSGDIIKKDFSFTIPAENSTKGLTYYWRPEKLRLVAFVHDYQDTYQVLQSAEAELLK